MSDRQAKAARRAERERLTEALLQAHDRLHRDDIEACHQVLHDALGIPTDTPHAGPDVAPLSQHLKFDQAFIQLCTRLRVRASYVLAAGQDPEKGTRLLSGGDAQLAGYIDQHLRSE